MMMMMMMMMMTTTMMMMMMMTTTTTTTTITITTTTTMMMMITFVVFFAYPLQTLGCANALHRVCFIIISFHLSEIKSWRLKLYFWLWRENQWPEN